MVNLHDRRSHFTPEALRMMLLLPQASLAWIGPLILTYRVSHFWLCAEQLP